MMKWIRRRRAWKRIEEDVNTLPGEVAADLCRTLTRLDAHPRLLLMMAVRGQQSTRPGDARSMEMRADALRAGRKIRYATFPARVLEPVDPELAAAVDAVFEEES